MTHLERALDNVLSGRYDISEKTVGNYRVTMKWDGYSAMCDFYHNNQHFASWDSLDKRIEVVDESKKEQVKKLKEAIVNLGYELKEVVTE